MVVPGTAQASPTPRTRASALTLPTLNHRYRHGAIARPTRAASVPAGLQEAATQSAAQSGRAVKGQLRYATGNVVTSSPRVYLVFWGQWGAETTVNGYATFANDPSGTAPELQALFSGLGTDGELWSAVATQYCQGVGALATSCPATAAHVAYPSHDVLAGVWEDPSFTQPTGTGPSTPSASGVQIAQEAADAAVHFGDTATSAQYVIVSPTGTNPDGWLDPTTGYCAYHDFTADWSGQVTGPDVAYTNMPYIPDISPGSCSSFASPGPLDGLTEAASHEYAETLTDPFPSSGWTDSRGNEIADKCAYLSAGQPGTAISLTLATGTFDVQGLWANDSGRKGGCETAHSPVLVTSPGKKELSVQGSPVSLQIAALDVLGRTLTFSAVNLPPGLSIGPSSGLVSGTPSSHGGRRVTVTASDGVGTTSVTFKWVVKR